MNAPGIDAARLTGLFTELRLPTIKVLWPQFTEQADQEGWPGARLLSALAELEITERAKRRRERHLAEARLWGGVRSLLLRPLSRPALLPRAKIPGSRPSRSENRGPLVNSQQETCMKIHTQ